MADNSLPQDNTERWFLDYEAAGTKHTLMARSVSGAPVSEANAHLHALLSALEPTLQQITILGLRRAVQGSNVSLPQPWTNQLSYGSGVQEKKDIPRFLSFVGRDDGGRRVRLFIYGTNAPGDENWRYTAFEAPTVGNALGVLRSSTGFFLSISRKFVIWNDYANYGHSAYWQRQRRIGG